MILQQERFFKQEILINVTTLKFRTYIHQKMPKKIKMQATNSKKMFITHIIVFIDKGFI